MTKARDIAEFPDNLNIGEKTNLLTNGDFTTDTSNWTATTSTLSINSSRLQIIPDASVNGFANQQVDNLVVGRSYIASVDIIQDAAPFGRLYIGTSANGNQTVTSSNLGVGTHSFTFVATATTHHFALVVGGGTGQTTIFDNARLTEANTITFPAISGTSPSIKQGTTVNDLAIATNNINRFNITNDGYVTKPNTPHMLAQGFSARVSGTDRNVFHTVTTNTGNNWNNTTGKFTCPVSGTYLVTAFSGYTQTSDYIGLGIGYNGSVLSYGWMHPNLARHAQSSVTIMKNANANDYFYYYLHPSYTTPISSSGNEHHSHLSVYLLG